eukprot:3468312-Rhodomonas_salina.1
MRVRARLCAARPTLSASCSIRTLRAASDCAANEVPRISGCQHDRPGVLSVSDRGVRWCESAD